MIREGERSLGSLLRWMRTRTLRSSLAYRHLNMRSEQRPRQGLRQARSQIYFRNASRRSRCCRLGPREEASCQWRSFLLGDIARLHDPREHGNVRQQADHTPRITAHMCAHQSQSRHRRLHPRQVRDNPPPLRLKNFSRSSNDSPHLWHAFNTHRCFGLYLSRRY
jgi:hypothetical protein